MRKILFVCYGLGIGGIERCLVNLINSLSEEKYEIDVLLMNDEKDLKTQIKRKVYFYDSYKYVYNTVDCKNYVKRHIFRLPGYIVFRLLVKMGGAAWRVFDKIPKKYDYAIAYSHHDYSVNYVIDKVDAKTKYLFYHNGAYEETEKKYETDQKYFAAFDRIFTVSESAVNILKKNFCDTSSKIHRIHNIVDTNAIIESAGENIIQFKTFTIATVGRMTEEKGVVTAIETAALLKKKGFDFVWNWVGDGNQREIANKLIHKYGLEKNFILKGNQLNPYVYMKQCNLYVQPSRYEAYCTTTNEARILNKVIIATDVGGMREQVIDGVTGFIVQNSPESLCEKISLLIRDVDCLDRMISNVQNMQWDFGKYIKEYEEIFS